MNPHPGKLFSGCSNVCESNLLANLKVPSYLTRKHQTTQAYSFRSVNDEEKSSKTLTPGCRQNHPVLQSKSSTVSTGYHFGNKTMRNFGNFCRFYLAHYPYLKPKFLCLKPNTEKAKGVRTNIVGFKLSKNLIEMITYTGRTRKSTHKLPFLSL